MSRRLTPSTPAWSGAALPPRLATASLTPSTALLRSTISAAARTSHRSACTDSELGSSRAGHSVWWSSAPPAAGGPPPGWLSGSIQSGMVPCTEQAGLSHCHHACSAHLRACACSQGATCAAVCQAGRRLGHLRRVAARVGRRARQAVDSDRRAPPRQRVLRAPLPEQATRGSCAERRPSLLPASDCLTRMHLEQETACAGAAFVLDA